MYLGSTHTLYGFGRIAGFYIVNRNRKPNMRNPKKYYMELITRSVIGNDTHTPHRPLDEDFDCALPTRDGATATAAGGRTRGPAWSLVLLRALEGASLGDFRRSLSAEASGTV